MDEQTLIAKITGDIDYESSKNLLLSIQNAIKNQTIQKLVLDFSEVNFMDNSGMEFLLKIHESLKLRNGICQVLNPPEYIARVIRISGINRVCKITTRVPKTQNIITL